MDRFEPTPFHMEYVGNEDDRALLAAHGELDLASYGELHATLRLIGHVYGAAVVDLGNVTFCDLYGLRALLRADEDLRRVGAGLTVRNPSRHLRKLFTLTGAHPRLRIEEPVSRAA